MDLVELGNVSLSQEGPVTPVYTSAANSQTATLLLRRPVHTRTTDIGFLDVDFLLPEFNKPREPL